MKMQIKKIGQSFYKRLFLQNKPVLVKINTAREVM